MVEYTRDKILPEDLIQKTNLQQHNFMITAINDIDGRQADIEDITNVNIDDIADLKTDVVALSNEKLDKADIDADLHFGDISVTRDGTAVLMSLDVFNPTTGIVTPISFTIPGATSALAGSMDASSVAWIADAENRISALEGLSDVKAVSGLSSEPTQAQLDYAWVTATSKQAETGDIIQDVDNAKLWVFVTDTWILYGTLIIVPMATTTSIGGIKDTALNTVGNRWYCHVEADGRVALIGGDVLSTLVDTTVPALQTALDGTVKTTGNQDIDGVKNFLKSIDVGRNQGTVKYITLYNENLGGTYEDIVGGRLGYLGEINGRPSGNMNTHRLAFVVGATNSRIELIVRRPDANNVEKEVTSQLCVDSDGRGWMTIPMRPSPDATDAVNKGYLDTRLTAKQDTLVFDSTPILNSTKPVTSGGIYNALIVKQDKFNLYEHTIRVWTTVASDKFRFTLTVLNQSPTEFTLPTLRNYLGSSAGDFKQCSGMVLNMGGTNRIHLTGVRGGSTTAFVLEGVNATGGSIDALSLDWMSVEVLHADKVRQIV